MKKGFHNYAAFGLPPSHAPKNPPSWFLFPSDKGNCSTFIPLCLRREKRGGGLEPSRTGNGWDRGKGEDKEVTVGGWVVGYDSLKTQLNDVESEGKHAVRS